MGKKLLMICGDYPPALSGVGDYVDRLCEHLVPHGVQPTLLTTASPAMPGDAQRPFTVVRAQPNWGAGAWGNIVNLARTCDLAHIQYPSVLYGRGPAINLLPARLRGAGVPVYLVRIGFSADYREISANNQNGQMIRSFGLFTNDAIPDVLRGSGDTEITAHRVSAFKGTDLDLSLRARGIDTLMMAGITTSGVVVSTLAEASDLDYRILLIADGCFEPDAAAQEALLRVPFATRAEITTTDALLAQL